MKRTKTDTELERYYVAVYRFLRGLSMDEQLAEDLTQETFSIALKEFDCKRQIARPQINLSAALIATLAVAINRQVF